MIGALGFSSLLTRYEAFNGHRLVILGSGDLAVQTATLALNRGLEVAALVEVRSAPQADVSALVARGVEVITGHAIQEARGTAEGVASAILADVGSGNQRAVSCDTIVLAIGAVPVVELADVAGARLRRSDAGAYVPTVENAPDGVFFAGDCAGLGGDAAVDGRVIARSVMRSLGHEVTAAEPSVRTPLAPADTDAYHMEWMRALIAAGGLDVVACSCEEVTRRDVLTVQPPRYLGAPIDRRDISTLTQDGPVNQDQIKRLTRACMGPCQARRCREQVAMLLAIGADVPLAQVALAGYRAPVRPLPLGVLAAADEIARDGGGLERVVRHPQTVDSLRRYRHRARNRPRRPHDAFLKDAAVSDRKAASVIIIGGGVTGLSAAWWLAREGVDVLVIDKGIVGWEASGRNGGGCTHYLQPALPRGAAAMAADGRAARLPHGIPARAASASRSTQAQLDAYQARGDAISRRHGLSLTDILDAQQTRALVPLAGDNVVGGRALPFRRPRQSAAHRAGLRLGDAGSSAAASCSTRPCSARDGRRPGDSASRPIAARFGCDAAGDRRRAADRPACSR